MIVVAIVGVLGALGTHGVRRYVNHARTAEARSALGRIAKDAAIAYERSAMEPRIIARGRSLDEVNRVCTSASRPVPRNMKSVTARKYQAGADEWSRDDATFWKGFACLKFTVQGAQWYQYDYQVSRNDWKNSWKAGTTFKAIARGDLDGNGVRSEFTVAGEIASGRGGLDLYVAPTINEVRPTD